MNVKATCVQCGATRTFKSKKDRAEFSLPACTKCGNGSWYEEE